MYDSLSKIQGFFFSYWINCGQREISYPQIYKRGKKPCPTKQIWALTFKITSLATAPYLKLKCEGDYAEYFS